MKIEKFDFEAWKGNEITKKVFEKLVEVRSNINVALTDATLVMDTESAKKMARLVGIREGIDLILQIEYEDVNEESKDD